MKFSVKDFFIFCVMRYYNYGHNILELCAFYLIFKTVGKTKM